MPRELYDVYARPFEAAIRLANLGSIMASYSELDGVPIHVSRAVLTDLLRDRLGFSGTVVSDYVGVAWAQTRQRVAETAEEVGALALAAGMDIELPIVHAYGQHLANAVQSGTVSESQLDESVRRVLRDKFVLGLFDDPYVPEEPIEIRSLASEGDDLSRRLATESVTLVKNDGLLPLDRGIAKIAVIGPHAESAIAGFPAYTYPAALEMLLGRLGGSETSMAGADASDAFLPSEAKAAMKAEFAEFSGVDLDEYVKSAYPTVSLAEAVQRLLPDAQVTAVAATGVTPSEPTNIPAAVEAAKLAEVVIFALGGHAAWSGRDVTEGEARDSANIDLPSQQVQLVEAVAALGKPTVAVVSMGRPQGLAAIVDRVPAILTAYYSGPHHAEAIADAIFGVTNPGGKLPFTIPRHVGQVPIHHAQKLGSGYRRNSADIHKGYLDMPSTPLFCFGHGLSYTTFEYGALQLESEDVDARTELQLSLTVTNTGNRRGSEVVQLYAADTATGVTLPAQQLIGFVRVDLEAGASETVAFEVPLSVLGYTGLSGDFVLEPGPIEVCAASSSNDVRSSATFTVTGDTRSIEGGERAFLSVARVGEPRTTLH